MQAGLRAVDAGRLVSRGLAHVPTSAAPVWIVAAGKAAHGMADAAVSALGARVTGGLVVSPVSASPPAPLDLVVAEHPQPASGSEDAGRRALAIAARVPDDARLLVLLSGGASSLLAAPAEGITLEDKRVATGGLLRSGADIHALNTVRKHLSRIKGGRLAAACRAESFTLVLSDVVGDDLSVIASGPTVADESTYADALRIVDTFGGRSAFPPRVVSHLEAGARGETPESPKPGDPRLARAHTTLIGGRRDAMRGAAAEAERRGYRVVVLDEAVVGEARIAGPALAQHALRLRASGDGPLCVVSSGETTVRVTGTGIGGRNQELALAAAPTLATATTDVSFASVGTDGIDGPTDAAGAIADRTTLARLEERGLPPVPAVLGDNNSHPVLDALGDLIRTGPSGTNVGDLQVFLLA